VDAFVVECVELCVFCLDPYLAKCSDYP